MEASSRFSFGLVVLNWNNGTDTIECLSALSQCSPLPERVVVVDNGSSDTSLHKIRDWAAKNLQAMPADWLTIIENGANLGFAGGTNSGMKHLLRATDVTHVMLLNNDAVVSPQFFNDMREVLTAVPNAGVIGPTIFEQDDRTKVWYAGGVELPYRAMVQHVHELPQTSAPRDTDFVTGCAMVVSRALIESVGMLGECYYPAYFEDGDYCHRAVEAGYRVIYAPAPVVYHKVGSTVREADIDLTYHKNRLRVIYVRRNYHGLTRAVALSYLAITKPGRAVFEAMRGHPAEGWAVLRGALSGFAARAIT